MKPKHIGIIPDGNRRWAKAKGITEYLAHSASGNYYNLLNLFNTAEKEGVKVFSLWGFSTENWNRDRKEIKEILNVIERGLDNFILNAPINEYQFKIIGRIDRLPANIVNKIKEIEKETKDHNKMQIVLGINYGGRDEILRAVNKAIKDGKIINEKKFIKYLDTEEIPDPDLIIRTGGEKRLSGFMPFQSTYSELIFTETLFPDFGPENLIEAIKEFENRKRKFGY